MKKLLTLSISAVLLVLASVRPADAWINAKISVGVNWNWRTGNNYLFGGLVSASQNPYGILDAGPPPAPVSAWPPAAPRTSTPAAQVYSPASYGGNPNGFYYPANYQPNYYGSAYNNAASAWYNPR
jgi:hypothetical protein